MLGWISAIGWDYTNFFFIDGKMLQFTFSNQNTVRELDES